MQLTTNRARFGLPGTLALHVRLVAVWHLLLSVVGATAVAYLWLANSNMVLWLKGISTAVLLILTIASALATLALSRRQHRGRSLSLLVNYLGFVFAFIAFLHYAGVFIGIDALANTFGRGVLFFGVILAGYLIHGMADRFRDYPQTYRRLQRSGNWIMLAGLVAFLLAVGLISGLLALISRLSVPLNAALFAAALLFGFMFWLMWRREMAALLGEKSRDSEMLNGYLFLSPNLLGFLLFFAGPLLLSLYVSFTDSDAFGRQNWIGLQNYGEIFNLSLAPLQSPTQLASEALDVRVYDELTRFTLFGRSYVLGAQDKLFWIALRNTVVFVLTAVPLSVIPALLLAAVLNSRVPGMKIFRTIYFLPSIAAVVGVALIWRWLYNSTVGWINYFITSIVTFINQLAGAEVLTDPQIGWLSDTKVALLAVVIIAAWQWMGFNTVLYLAGLQNIPKSLYEAATVDGANSLTQFFRITIPLLAPTTFFVVSTTTIQAMQIFDQVYVLTNPPGGPGTSTTTIVLYLYTQGFRNFRQGYASAIAWVLFLLIFGLTIFQFQRQRSAAAE